MLDKDTISGTLSAEGLDDALPPQRIEELRQYGQGVHRFVTTRVDDPDLIAELKGADVRFRGRVENGWLSALLSWVLPIVLFFGLWSLLVTRMAPKGGLMSTGKSKAKVYVERSTGVSFDDVAGIDEARAELQEIVDFLRRPQWYRRLGGKIAKGVVSNEVCRLADSQTAPCVPSESSAWNRATLVWVPQVRVGRRAR